MKPKEHNKIGSPPSLPDYFPTSISLEGYKTNSWSHLYNVRQNNFTISLNYIYHYFDNFDLLKNGSSKPLPENFGCCRGMVKTQLDCSTKGTGISAFVTNKDVSKTVI